MGTIEAICLLAFLLTVVALLWSPSIVRLVRKMSVVRVLKPGASVFYYVMNTKEGDELLTLVCSCTVIEKLNRDYVKVVWCDGKLGYEKIDGFWESADVIRVWNGLELTEGGRML